MGRQTLEEIFDYDFILFSINSVYPDYKICYLINSSLGIQMQKEPPVELQNKTHRGLLQFSMFQYYDEETFLNYELISNRSFNSVSSISKKDKKEIRQIDLFGQEEEANQEIGFLIPELEKTDFLFIIRTETDPNTILDLESSLKKINEITNLRFIKPDDLDSKKNLIF